MYKTFLSTAMVLVLVLGMAKAVSCEVLLGNEVLQRDNFKLLKGKRIGLITNHTGVTKKGARIIDLIYENSDMQLTALFSPEHGIGGTEDTLINGQETEPRTGTPIYSLYGKTMKPAADTLKNVDVLVFDIQDIGTRFYTYITTMIYCMQAAKENNKQFIVLDRPNPIGGIIVEGNIPTKQFLGMFTSYYPITVKHGMTIGELAMMFNKEHKIDCDLQVVKVEGWNRKMYFDETGIPWVNPSPNMKTLNGAILYAGTAYFESGTNIAEGRGTEKPFEYVGAPWINGEDWAKELNSRKLPGVVFEPITFTPDPTLPYKYKGQLCNGVYVKITDREKLKAVEVGLHMVDSAIKLYPDKFQIPVKFDRLSCNPDIRKMLIARKPVSEIVKQWKKENQEFQKIRKKYLLYD